MKKLVSIVLTMAMAVSVMTGCAAKSEKTEQTTATTQTQVQTEEQENASDENIIRVGSLKGPTSMGLVSLMDKASKGETQEAYDFTMATAADELVSKFISSELDIALVPANIASIIYNKTQCNAYVIDINTLGVLYMVSSDESMTSMSDLAGKTIYMTGKGTSPDYVLNYLLTANGLTTDDVTIEYKSEATEVVSVLAQDSEAIGLLPQPFVTVATSQNEALKVIFDLTKEWENVQGENGSSLVTGVTVVRKAFLVQHPEAVAAFMEDHKASAEFVNTNVEEAAQMVADLGIIEKAPVAQKAIPQCHITYIDGEEMKTALSGYLEVLYEQNPESVGNTLPTDEFYYIP